MYYFIQYNNKRICTIRNRNVPETLGIYQELRMQALLGMKRYASVEKNSIEYAKLFPRKKQEFELHELQAKIGLKKYDQARKLLDKLLSQYPAKEFILWISKIKNRHTN